MTFPSDQVPEPDPPTRPRDPFLARPMGMVLVFVATLAGLWILDPLILRFAWTPSFEEAVQEAVPLHEARLSGREELRIVDRSEGRAWQTGEVPDTGGESIRESLFAETYRLDVRLKRGDRTLMRAAPEITVCMDREGGADSGGVRVRHRFLQCDERLHGRILTRLEPAIALTLGGADGGRVSYRAVPFDIEVVVAAGEGGLESVIEAVDGMSLLLCSEEDDEAETGIDRTTTGAGALADLARTSGRTVVPGETEIRGTCSATVSSSPHTGSPWYRWQFFGRVVVRGEVDPEGGADWKGDCHHAVSFRTGTEEYSFEMEVERTAIRHAPRRQERSLGTHRQSRRRTWNGELW